MGRREGREGKRDGWISVCHVTKHSPGRRYTFLQSYLVSGRFRHSVGNFESGALHTTEE